VEHRVETVRDVEDSTARKKRLDWKRGDEARETTEASILAIS
jgi:hypothetical protein